MTDMCCWKTVMQATFSLVVLQIPVFARDADDEFISAVLELTGCESVEELGEYEMERYYELYSAPLQLNMASRSRLLSSGLLSAYQTAVLLDYRELSGDILSFEELSALDGFGYAFVSGLKFFVSLSSDAAPGHSSSSSAAVRNSLTLKSGVRNTDENIRPQGTYSLKYRLSAGDFFEAGVSLRSAYGQGHFPPEKYSFFAAYYGRRFPGKVVIGDYTLRFGQGLALWPGFSLAGAATPDAFSRRPSGISPYNSYSGEGAFRGIAADYGRKHFNMSLFVSGTGLRAWMEGEEDAVAPELLYGANVGWYGMHGQVSMTGFAVSGFISGEEDASDRCGFRALRTAKCSADARFSLRGTDLFSEVAYDIVAGSTAVLAGSRFSLSDAFQMAVLARYYPADYSSDYSGAVRSGSKCSNEYGFSASMSHSAGKWVGINGKTGFGSSEKRFSGSVSLDASYSPEPKFGVDTSSLQIKLTAAENMRVSPCFSLAFRFSERYRSYGRPFRTDVRTDFRFSYSKWNWNLRLNMLHCESLAGLSYLETGYVSDRLSVWLRTGFFRVDDWDDRIYAYERDAPGNFNSPAYYGRGYWLALTSGWRAARGLRLYFRGLFQNWPWLRPGETERKPPKAEFRIQLVLDMFRYPDRKRQNGGR